MLDVFNSYITKQKSGGDGDRSDELSDVESEMDNKDKVNDTDSDLVRTEYENNALVHNRRDGDTKRFKEFQELVKLALFGEKIDNDETQSKKKYDEHTPPTRGEEFSTIHTQTGILTL